MLNVSGFFPFTFIHVLGVSSMANSHSFSSTWTREVEGRPHCSLLQKPFELPYTDTEDCSCSFSWGNLFLPLKANMVQKPVIQSLLCHQYDSRFWTFSIRKAKINRDPRQRPPAGRPWVGRPKQFLVRRLLWCGLHPAKGKVFKLRIFINAFSLSGAPKCKGHRKDIVRKYTYLLEVWHLKFEPRLVVP